MFPPLQSLCARGAVFLHPLTKSVSATSAVFTLHCTFSTIFARDARRERKASLLKKFLESKDRIHGLDNLVAIQND